ncbi:MAG: hypothetical protein KKG76_02635 [Euryarchaeota archaeon]|nr:hypothetical protein [Euryarchaeota archaeon]
MGEVSISLFETTWYHWITFFSAAIIGGMASSFVNNSGRFKMWGLENKDKKYYNMGIMADIIIGVAASLAILSTMMPQTYYQFLGIGAIGGYGGSTILRALVNKVEANANLEKAQKFEVEAVNSEKFKNDARSVSSDFETYKFGYDKVYENIEKIRLFLEEKNIKILEELNSKRLLDLPIDEIREK